ncbi:MAG: outer membrane beta-barrel protein [Bacteroidales bacterium]|nr:outer membrane beta-barrel protein [Bacteroidales bacterium]
MITFKKLMLTVALAMSSMFIVAQESTNETPSQKNSIYVSGDLGLGILNGDFNKLKLDMNGHLGVGYKFDNYIGLKANVGYGSFNGGYENHILEESNYFEANLNLTLDLTNIILGYNPDRKFSAIPHIGLGQLQYRINLTNTDGSTYFREGYGKDSNVSEGGINGRKSIATIPMGLELNYKINPQWNVYLDFTTNYSDSDLIDGLKPGDHHNDWFYSINLGANYVFNNKIHNFFKSTDEFCNYWYLTLDGGATLLFADNNFYLSTMRHNFSIGAGYDFRNYYRIYAKLGKGVYNGNGRVPEFFFEMGNANYLNATLNLSADVIGLIFGENEDRRVTLYPHIGIGQTQFRATNNYLIEGGGEVVHVGYNNNDANNNRGDGIDGRKTAFTYPLGLELVYNYNETTEFYADVTTNYTNSDLMDCLTDGYNYDAYSTINVGLRYKFNRLCGLDSNDESVSAEEIKQAVREAVAQQQAEEATENAKSYITPEELKQAVKDAIQEYEASRPKQESVLSPATVINNNYSDISFPKNGAQKVKTQTNIDALNRASNQVTDGSAVNRIIVEGYASPEGSNAYNERLAQKRAEEAVEIIKKELGEIETERIEISNKGADWEGLMNAIAASEIENSEEIIDEIKNSSNREETLKGLMEQYPQIKQLLPQLRRASVVITTVK